MHFYTTLAPVGAKRNLRLTKGVEDGGWKNFESNPANKYLDPTKGRGRGRGKEGMMHLGWCQGRSAIGNLDGWAHYRDLGGRVHLHYEIVIWIIEVGRAQVLAGKKKYNISLATPGTIYMHDILE